MRQVQINVLCDACAAWHQTENAVDVGTVPVSAGQTLDLCGSHRADLAPLLSLIAEWGQQPDAPRKRKSPAAPVVATSAPEAPAQASNGASKRGGARARARRANAAMAAAEPARLICPLCSGDYGGADSMNVHLRTQHQTNGQQVYGGVCPVCGNEGSARGLGTHGGKAHQTHSVHELFALAQAQGDPHGVVAGRAKVLAQQT